MAAIWRWRDSYTVVQSHPCISASIILFLYHCVLALIFDSSPVSSMHQCINNPSSYYCVRARNHSLSLLFYTIHQQHTACCHVTIHLREVTFFIPLIKLTHYRFHCVCYMTYPQMHSLCSVYMLVLRYSQRSNYVQYPQISSVWAKKAGIVIWYLSSEAVLCVLLSDNWWCNRLFA